MWQRQRQKVGSEGKKDETVNFIKLPRVGSHHFSYWSGQHWSPWNCTYLLRDSKDDYKEEGGEYEEQGGEYEEEEDRERLQQQKHYLELRRTLKEQIKRKQKKELNSDSRAKKSKYRRLGAGPVKCENVAADEKESIPSKPEFYIEAGSVGNLFSTLNFNTYLIKPYR
ncbi:hypothetical protein Tco_0216951 [Tanacetum coccineum]